MRRMLVLVMAAALAVALPGGGASASERSCAGKAARVLARGDEALAYRAANGAYYGCLYRTGRSLFIRTAALPLHNVRSHGPFVAFSIQRYVNGEDGSDQPAAVFSIGVCRRDGRRFKHVGASGDAAVGDDPVTDLVLTRTGEIAWIAAPPEAGGEVRVMKADASGGTTTVATGTDIGVHSLRLRGRRLSWTRAGTREGERLRTRVSTCRPARR